MFVHAIRVIILTAFEALRSALHSRESAFLDFKVAAYSVICQLSTSSVINSVYSAHAHNLQPANNT